MKTALCATRWDKPLLPPSGQVLGAGPRGLLGGGHVRGFSELCGPQWASRPWHLAVYQRARGERGQSIDPLHFQKLTLS